MQFLFLLLNTDLYLHKSSNVIYSWLPFLLSGPSSCRPDVCAVKGKRKLMVTVGLKLTSALSSPAGCCQ